MIGAEEQAREKAQGKAKRRGSGAERGELPRDRRLAVRRLVLVDDALADGLVELARRLAQQRLGVAGVRRRGLVELADGGLQRRLDRLVAHPALLVLPVALDLGLDVRHATASSVSERDYGLDGAGNRQARLVRLPGRPGPSQTTPVRAARSARR